MLFDYFCLLFGAVLICTAPWGPVMDVMDNSPIQMLKRAGHFTLLLLHQLKCLDLSFPFSFNLLEKTN